jgi:hypothetical protein
MLEYVHDKDENDGRLPALGVDLTIATSPGGSIWKKLWEKLSSLEEAFT